MTVSSSLVAIKANVISTRAAATTRLTTLLPSIDSSGDEQQQQQLERRAASTGSGLEASDDSEDICITCAASSSCAHTGKSLAKVDFRFRPPPTFSSSRCYSCYLSCSHCFSCSCSLSSSFCFSHSSCCSASISFSSSRRSSFVQPFALCALLFTPDA